jgi:ABC-type sulfate/molybdate transport systems ATPase subunit
LVPAYQRNLGFLFQSNALWPHLTVAQNIAFGLRGDKNLDIDMMVEEILERMDLSALRTRYPNQLSGGQLRRTALARTIVTRPDYLLLDEPLTNLDEDLQSSLVEYLVRLVKDEGITTLIVTHNKGLINSLDGDKYTLEGGKLYAE